MNKKQILYGNNKFPILKKDKSENKNLLPPNNKVLISVLSPTETAVGIIIAPHIITHNKTDIILFRLKTEASTNKDTTNNK